MPRSTSSPTPSASTSPRRMLGNPYANDATYEVAVTLGSNSRVWDLIQAKGWRAGGRVDPEMLRAHFEPRLATAGLDFRGRDLAVADIVWQEVADEFVDEDEVRRLREPGEPSHDAHDDAGAVRSPSKGGASRASNPPRAKSLQMAVADRVEGEPDDPDPVKSRPIAADALQVLRESTANEVGVYLPPRQLPPALYKKVNDVLSALGGKWNSKKRCHVFAGGDPMEILEVAASSGSYVRPQDFGCFFTPAGLAESVAEIADLEPGMLVLEPNGGHGALADAAAAIVGAQNVHTVELLASNRKVLRDKGYTVVGEDFLAMEPQPLYDRVLMNPPFSALADIAHVQHAAKFLKPDGKLVSITSPSFTFRETKRAQAFRDLLDQAGGIVQEVPRGAFKEAGTDVATVILTLDAARLPREAWGPNDPRHAAAAPADLDAAEVDGELDQEEDEHARERMTA